jgi:hypothetical protein
MTMGEGLKCWKSRVAAAAAAAADDDDDEEEEEEEEEVAPAGVKFWL